MAAAARRCVAEGYFSNLNVKVMAMAMDQNNLWLGFQMPRRLAADPETLPTRYGRFSAQPFERGFGTTIGNSLRRALLSSIEGAAITAVKIEGVLHEFSSIPRVG